MRDWTADARHFNRSAAYLPARQLKTRGFVIIGD
jgi:hypothetical protein